MNICGKGMSNSSMNLYESLWVASQSLPCLRFLKGNIIGNFSIKTSLDLDNPSKRLLLKLLICSSFSPYNGN